MAIPEAQLETWSHQGSIAQSSRTYNTIKNVLEAPGIPYEAKDFRVFLQGSYGNDTNIYAESDVDIVIQSNECFFHDLSRLPEVEQHAFHIAYPGQAQYDHIAFKRDVIATLEEAYEGNVDPGDKAIAIAANGNRRKADVIAAVQYRRYYQFLGRGPGQNSFDEGICFFTKSGDKLANYPRQHSGNVTRKHQATGEWFKPMARILKNMREKLKEEKMITVDVAPSYYLEGLLYNAPNEQFGESFTDCFVNCINWISEADRSKFVCANEQYYLLREGSPITWRAEKCDQFLSAAIELWKQW